MYKIQFLIVMLLWCLTLSYAQQPGQRRTSPRQHPAKTIVLSTFLSDLIYTAKSHRPTVFTDHPLASQVDPGRKHESGTSTGGQQASLSYLTPCQTPFQ